MLETRKPHILSEDNADDIIGFFTLIKWLIRRSELPSIGSVCSSVPMTLDAVHKYQSQGLTWFLVASTADLAANGTSGSRGRLVQAKNEKLLGFYKRNGFILSNQEICVVLFS